MNAATPAKSTFETITVETASVACDGNAAAGLGHPRVYLDLTAHGEIVCPYCSVTYKLAADAKVGHH
ncbi:zinc-finger domain-containing protein [Magnetospirillum sp. SS-4]|uniref:zinc-finger domain-containing protein n=1 Tax=Magnetospirillum sp. SS-4 TaxID=2681465 RepID=UPI00137CB70E|nr:zinc-finger domain-containing protein [Magnetospirillum sp. SS-4]CAA7619325.1 conserved hypothetical protein [Magnetospirillum sp. SS-4]